tara:strand:+ start:12240 stop:12482 length:243 start_codon:yes stop_codon:yes gene_type:complete
MSIQYTHRKGASAILAPALPYSALLSSGRNYKFEVLKELERQAYGLPPQPLAFESVPLSAEPFFAAMAIAYNLELYYKLK